MSAYEVPEEWVQRAAQIVAPHLFRDTSPALNNQRARVLTAMRAALAAVLSRAIAAERERCARVAENESDYCPCGGPPCQTPPGHGCGVQQANGERIAAAIRGDAT